MENQSYIAIPQKIQCATLRSYLVNRSFKFEKSLLASICRSMNYENKNRELWSFLVHIIYRRISYQPKRMTNSEFTLPFHLILIIVQYFRVKSYSGGHKRDKFEKNYWMKLATFSVSLSDIYVKMCRVQNLSLIHISEPTRPY